MNLLVSKSIFLNTNSTTLETLHLKLFMPVPVKSKIVRKNKFIGN